MDWKLFATAFGVTFVAELGDKTQLAALALSAANPRPVTVFFGAWIALGVATAMGVVVGSTLGQYLSERALGIGAGFLFMLLGAWTLWRAFASPGPAA